MTLLNKLQYLFNSRNPERRYVHVVIELLRIEDNVQTTNTLEQKAAPQVDGSVATLAKSSCTSFLDNRKVSWRSCNDKLVKITGQLSLGPKLEMVAFNHIKQDVLEVMLLH